MPAESKEAEARVKKEPEDAAAGVKRERPEEDAAGLAGAKHVKAEPKIEPERSGAATPLPAACGAGLRCGGARCIRPRPPARSVAWRRVRAAALSLCPRASPFLRTRVRRADDEDDVDVDDYDEARLDEILPDDEGENKVLVGIAPRKPEVARGPI